MDKDTPTHEQLILLIKSLRGELSELLLEYSEFVNSRIPEAAARWYKAFGELENQCTETSEKLQKIKRKITLFLQALNQGKKPNEEKIDRQIEQEISNSKKMFEPLEEPLSPEKQKDLRKKYFFIMRQLHPDLNPEKTNVQEKLMEYTQAAFESLDYESMQNIFWLVDPTLTKLTSSPKNSKEKDETRTEEESKTALKKLLEASESLQKSRVRLLNRIETLKNLPQIQNEAMLDDPQEVKEYRSVLQKKLDFLTDSYDQCLKRLAELRTQGLEMEDE